MMPMTAAEIVAVVIGGGLIFSVVVDLMWIMYLLYKGKLK